MQFTCRVHLCQNILWTITRIDWKRVLVGASVEYRRTY